ncbi:MAG: prepilin-type N-terminal cleavage/methylation domain-containing protein [Armatimonadota bacterium]|jgi:prepilin-type N-terminal cleavage/methylation domain-containing protein
MTPFRRKKYEDGGFTLVEVLAAVLLLSIALLAILSANSAAKSTQRRATGLAAGRCVAESIIEQIKAAPFDDARTMSFPRQDDSLPDGNSIAVTISWYPNISERNLLKAVVKVSWPEANGTRTLQYETLRVRK